MSCQKGPRYSTDELGKLTVETFAKGDVQSFSKLLVSKAEYRYLVGQMKRSREYNDFDQDKRNQFQKQTIEIAQNYDKRMERILNQFKTIRSDSAKSIDWTRIRYEKTQLFESSQFMGQVRFDEMNVFFSADSSSYCLQIEGIIKVRDSWKLVANTLTLLPAL
jgi:hypothetical protein